MDMMKQCNILINKKKKKKFFVPISKIDLSNIRLSDNTR